VAVYRSWRSSPAALYSLKLVKGSGSSGRVSWDSPVPRYKTSGYGLVHTMLFPQLGRFWNGQPPGWRVGFWRIPRWFRWHRDSGVKVHLQVRRSRVHRSLHQQRSHQSLDRSSRDHGSHAGPLSWLLWNLCTDLSDFHLSVVIRCTLAKIDRQSGALCFFLVEMFYCRGFWNYVAFTSALKKWSFQSVLSCFVWLSVPRKYCVWTSIRKLLVDRRPKGGCIRGRAPQIFLCLPKLCFAQKN